MAQGQRASEQPLQGLSGIVLTTTFAPSGAAWAVADCARMLRELGARVSVWALTSGGLVAEELMAEGFQLHVLGLGKHSWRLSTSMRLAAAIAKARPDFVHAHNYEPVLHASRALARAPSIRLLATLHDPRLRLSRAAFLLPVRRRPDAYMFPSAPCCDAHRRLFRLPPERMYVVPCPVDVTRFAPRPPESPILRELSLQDCYPVITWVATLHPRKGHIDLLRAFELVRQRFPDARLVLVGSGKFEAAIRRHISARGLEAAVLLTGARSDVPAILSITDIFACPSHAETACRAMQEAMAAAKPIVTTAHWGAVDFIEHERTGLLVPIGDWQALGRAIIRLAEDRELARRMGEAAREFAVEHFAWPRVREKLAAVYEHVFARSGTKLAGG